MKSILQKNKECYICGRTNNLHEHHVIHGTANRKKSEEQGLKVWLCVDHHTGTEGVHTHKELDNKLKQKAELEWLLYDWNRSIQDFYNIFGINYL